MSLQIANPTVVAKVERLSKATGLTKTAAVERAVDLMLRDAEGTVAPSKTFAALLAQLDRIPERADAFDATEWDALGLPK